MTTEQFVSYDPDDQLASTVVGPGRYCVVAAKFVDDFDYGGTQKQKGTAALLQFQDADGKTYEQHIGVGDKSRIYPSPDGQHLVGGQLSENCNWARVMKFALQNAGLPKTRLWSAPGVPAEIQNIFAGIWGDWISFLPEGQPKTRKNAKGDQEENRGHLVPNKFYMDGDTVQAPAAPSVATSAPATPPPPQAAPTPPHSAPAPATPPPPATVTTVYQDRFPAMMEITRIMVEDTAIQHTRAQLMTEVFNKLDLSDLGEIEQHDMRSACMSSVMSEFTEFMVANGMKVEAEVVSVA